jgi:hypothetical protein
MQKVSLILIGCLTLILVMTGCGSSSNQTEPADQTDLRLGVAALTSLADNHIYGYLDLLKDLASNPAVESAQWEQMKYWLAKPLQNRVITRIFFILPDGTSYTSDLGKTNQNLSDREYFSRLMKGETVVGTILVGKISSTKSCVVAVPVTKDGKVVGALGTTPYLDELSQTLSREIGLDNSRIFYALDKSGVVALSSDPTQIMQTAPVLSQNVIWQTSTLTDWRFALGSPAK